MVIVIIMTVKIIIIWSQIIPVWSVDGLPLHCTSEVFQNVTSLNYLSVSNYLIDVLLFIPKRDSKRPKQTIMMV